MKTNSISPQAARVRISEGALLLDVRAYPEWRQSHVAGATLIPLHELQRNPRRGALGDEVLVICQLGHRSQLATKLLSANGVNAHSIEGGLNAWQSAGLPSQKADGEFIELERQIRIAAGAFVLAGLLVPRARFVLFRRHRSGRDGFLELVRSRPVAGQDAVESRARRRTRAQFENARRKPGFII